MKTAHKKMNKLEEVPRNLKVAKRSKKIGNVIKEVKRSGEDNKIQ